MDPAEKYETWAIVELFGHKKLAGYIAEQQIAGAALVRIDVPATTEDTSSYGNVHPGTDAYTKLVGVAAIYAITPCTEEVARRCAREIERYNQPIPVDLPKLLAAPASEPNSDWSAHGADEDEEEDESAWDCVDDDDLEASRHP